jgi:Sigma-70 region 2
MGFHDDLVLLRHDPGIVRLALRRARSREAAEDALQETYYNVARMDPGTIHDLRAFFCKALINEIRRQLSQANAIPVDDIAITSDRLQISTPTASISSTDVEDEACSRELAETLIARFEEHHSSLIASIPRRSPSDQSYRAAIAAASMRILRLLLAGDVVRADWNSVLRAEYPQYLDDPHLTRDAMDQRLSRARRDVRELLRKIIPPGRLSY